MRSDPWEELAEAQLLSKLTNDSNEDVDSDEDEVVSAWLLGGKAPPSRGPVRAVCRAWDGTVHECRVGCPFLIENSDARFVCTLTGIEYYGVMEHCETSEGCGRANADMRAVGPRWKKRTDPRSTSVSAYVLGTGFDDSVSPVAFHDTRNQRNPKTLREGETKSNAVYTRMKEHFGGRRRNATKRNYCATADGCRALHDEVRRYIKCIMQKRTLVSPTSTPDVSGVCVNPHLLDWQGLYDAAVRKYARDASEKRIQPSMDVLHNIAMAVNEIVEVERCKQRSRQTQKEEQKKDTSLSDTRDFVRIVCDLVICLWKECVSSPFFTISGTRCGDSFRIFAMGVIYALKRGVTTRDSTVIVPAIPTFAAALPTAKELLHASPTVRSLHAASHKGMGLLHRTIASVPIGGADVAFKDSIRIAERLSLMGCVKMSPIDGLETEEWNE
jgi:hypothetical protein